ncbi:2-dehydro-3-deoxyphosphogluconate aldolase/(4S)-4-hydroxy-2-oxoglutarate aldolase [Lactobacillus colini]|uniref:2-dehydro-3-deoxyphosphogluconate aldolase/(4S)-4-hydroxy-2-oxoglutarate aldolase n=1 Tax=Lactobacillus colini TaxID=1819254 RepID=A0ABS4MFN6_9LACO|nr:bifunctional 4-hydroxy-2-oxoglutarate aldolase/2-dehydro-3-deoxy-phosphogluconate aldolase [Lactobacillus colini]MBP2058500.1 2-dehydro-3-deoxyphosphogluconate aldolase/(4S)-4-hydroxy-2-oxoglutarate aldolase [Lactobacillus colini]
MQIGKYPRYTIIMREYSLDESRSILKALKGLENEFAVEITMNTVGATDIIKKLNDEFGEKIIIGAGTVLNFDSEVRAINSGAKFILSACTFDKKMIDYAKEHNVLTIPGAMTPTEIYSQLSLGADIVKVFPANTVGADYFKNIFGPLNGIRLMAVGGISKSNAESFFKNGVRYLGIGSGAFNKEDVRNMDISKLHQSLIDLVHIS